MKKFIIVLVISLQGILLFGQNKVPEPQILSQSPESYAFTKYDKVPVNLHGGLPVIEVPIYNIKTKSGYEVPIKLTYHSSGIKVNEIATQVGLGWRLEYGGMITKEVYGLPDDTTPLTYPSITLNLFNIPEDYSCSAITYNQEISYNYALDVIGVGNLSQNLIAPTINSNPDIFYYNTPNSNGKFVFDSTGKSIFMPYNGNSLKVVLGGYFLNDNLGNGFEFKDVEIKSTMPNNSYLRDYIESIKLSKITTSNGELINYNYSSKIYSYQNPKSYQDETFIPGSGNSCYNTTYLDTPSSSTKINSKRLENIDFEEGKISFIYSDDINFPIENSNSRKDLVGSDALRSIVIFDKRGKKVKEFILEYSYFTSGSTSGSLADHHRLKLDKVITDGNVAYEFKYFGDGFLPSRFSESQDYWGYYTRNSSGLLTSVSVNNNFNISGASRVVDDLSKKTGTIREIIYPTKGKSNFFFNEIDYFKQVPRDVIHEEGITFDGFGTKILEQLPRNDGFIYRINIFNECGNIPGDLQSIENGYCYFTLREISSNRVLGQYTNTGGFVTLEKRPSHYKFEIQKFPFQECNCVMSIKGQWKETIFENQKIETKGLRLDKVVNTPNIGEPIIVNYNYTNPNNNLYSRNDTKPKFYYQKSVKNVDINNFIKYCKYIVRSSSPIHSSEESGFEYVTESQNNKGKTVTLFSKGAKSTITSPLLNVSIDDLNSGVVLEEYIYDNNAKMLNKKVNTFETDYSLNSTSKDYDASIPEAILPGLSFSTYGSHIDQCLGSQLGYKYINYNFYHIYNAWFKKTKTLTESYFGNDKIVTEINYFYDNPSHLQLTREEFINSNGENLITKYFYANELGNQAMIDKKMVGIPLKTQVFKNGEKLSQQETVYASDVTANNIILPKYILDSKGEQNTETKLTYNSYDDKGNITQYTVDGRVPVAFIWGYNKTQPVAKIENATYLSIPAGLITAIETASSSTGSEASLLAALTGLRNDPALVNAMVTTYTYKPLIGISTMTDPKGNTMTYNYDSFGRLQNVKDKDGNTLSENVYNYKQ
jgi:YD repeat-containing protein